MYESYFGLAEKPFAISPDPQYLYLSQRHREGLAHLLFGVQERGGFVQLTGEVGTGKTLLARALIEQLPDNVRLAYVYNPPRTVRELLDAVFQELDIEPPARRHSVRDLTDRLNEYLLQGHARGHTTVVVVDEAQTLSTDLIEQLRLLTNLETHKTKLLQIIMMGQPELQDLLARPQLRQVAQRITARYHLEPLDSRETGEYIRHRLAVAGCRRPLFSAGAVSVVHRESRGVPRLINVICDRTLLGAYAAGHNSIDARIARQAAREVAGRPPPRRRAALVALAAAGIALVALLGWPLVSGLLDAGRLPWGEPAAPEAAAGPSSAEVR